MAWLDWPVISQRNPPYTLAQWPVTSIVTRLVWHVWPVITQCNHPYNLAKWPTTLIVTLLVCTSWPIPTNGFTFGSQLLPWLPEPPSCCWKRNLNSSLQGKLGQNLSSSLPWPCLEWCLTSFHVAAGTAFAQLRCASLLFIPPSVHKLCMASQHCTGSNQLHPKSSLCIQVASDLFRIDWAALPHLRALAASILFTTIQSSLTDLTIKNSISIKSEISTSS